MEAEKIDKKDTEEVTDEMIDNFLDVEEAKDPETFDRKRYLDTSLAAMEQTFAQLRENMRMCRYSGDKEMVKQIRDTAKTLYKKREYLLNEIATLENGR